MKAPPFHFAIAATFTAGSLESVLSFFGRRLDSEFDIQFAGYNQVQQALLDPTSVFARNTHGVNVALVRVEDLGQFEQLSEAARGSIEENLRSLLNAVRDACLRLPAPLIFCLCPPSDAVLANPALHRWLPGLNDLAERFLEDVSRLHVLRWSEIAARYPVARVNDADLERLGRIPYTQEFFCALGASIARLAHALYNPPYKVIVLDCDNTLWTGVCGEDGPEGVAIDDVRRNLQLFALEKREEGALLAIASKNNEQDVFDTFAANPEMPLRLEHFTSLQINWETKAQSLASIAAELNLGLDSFIFVDDNPSECAEVADALPEVVCLTLPDRPASIPRFLRHVWAFDHPVVTEEDRRRNAYYATAQEFGRELKKAETFEQFLDSLQLQIDLHPAAEAELARAAQLTQRTNQFNFTTVRRTEAELRQLLADPGTECLVASVSDRFGDYGVTSVVIASDTADTTAIDTFLLSCRILGRGVEHRILAEVARRAVARGRRWLRFRTVATAKNLPAREFLGSVLNRGIDAAGEFATVEAASLTGIRYRPAASPAVPAPGLRSRASRKFVDFARIALELSTPAQILDAMRRVPAKAHSGPVTTESRLAAIWRDLLGSSNIALSDNFFDIGGHSLPAVLLIVRVKEEFGIELPVEDVYSPSMTLEGLALKIDAYRLSGVSPGEYADLVAQIEQLSDEEAERLLARDMLGEEMLRTDLLAEERLRGESPATQQTEPLL